MGSEPDLFNCHAIHGVGGMISQHLWALARNSNAGVKTPEEKQANHTPA